MYSDDGSSMPEDMEGVGDELWWDRWDVDKELEGVGEQEGGGWDVDEEVELSPDLVSGSYFPQSQLCMTFRSKIYSL